MTRRLIEKHIPLCLWGQTTTHALYPIDLPPCISNKKKGKWKYLLFPYSLWNGIGQKNIYCYACKAKERQTRYIPLIYLHAFPIWKMETSPFSYSILYVIEQKNIARTRVRPKDDKRGKYHWSTSVHFEERKKKKKMSIFFLIRYEKAMKRYWIENHYDCEAKRWQTCHIPLIYRHAFRIREKEMSPFCLFARKRRWIEKKHIALWLWGQKTTHAL